MPGIPRNFVPLKAAAWLCLSFLMLVPPCVIAKQKPPVTKSISGAVLDASNNGISGASVLLTDAQTHQTNAMYSAANGNYEFSGLDPNHDYKIQAKYKGMVSGVHTVSSFDSRTIVVVNLVLSAPTSASPQ